MLLLLFGASFLNVIVGQEVGDKCTPTRDISTGKCTLVTDCEDALRYINLKKMHPFERCGFRGINEIVCCPSVGNRNPITTQIPNDRYGVPSEMANKQCKTIMKKSIPPLNVHIIGGEDAQQGEFPHMVALGYLKDDGYDFSCGGSLISDNYVLTAAHCVDNIEQITPSIARLGVVEIGKNAFNPDTDIRVAEIISYPPRTSIYKYHDLALLRLASPVQYSATQFPACLYTGDAIPSVPLTVTGWGRIDVTKDIRSKILQKANVTLVSSSECEKSYNNWRKLPAGIGEGQFCAGDPQGRTDACQGDSGGPIQALTSQDGYYRIVGITSFGRGCGSSVPGVYTRVYPYLQWIQSVVWP